jgi:hypothetical protein
MCRDYTLRVRLPPILTKNACVVVVAIAVAALRIGGLLFLPPVVGLADNGDFERVMARVGLGYVSDRYDERYWAWSQARFTVSEKTPTRHVTTEVPLAWMAVRLSRLLDREPTFDIRYLGALHFLLFLGAMAVLLRACRDLPAGAQWLVAALFVFVFTDVGYVAPFNSLYGQTSSLLGLLWVVAIAASAIRAGRMTLLGLVAYFGAAAWFVGSKPQECLLAPFLAVFGWLLWSASSRRARALLPAALFAFGLLGFGAWVYERIPRVEIHDVGLYHTVFMELLPSSPDPGRDLRELGLDPSLVRFSGRHAYLKDSPLEKPDFHALFFERFDYGRLLGYYAARPARLLDRLGRAGRLSFRLRPENLANLSRESGAPANSIVVRGDAWSRWRLALGSWGLVWIAIVLGANAVFGVREAWRASTGQKRLFGEGLAVLAALGAVEFGVCALADSLNDLPRHAYLFQAVFDLLLIVDAGWITSRLAGARASAPASPR